VNAEIVPKTFKVKKIVFFEIEGMKVVQLELWKKVKITGCSKAKKEVAAGGRVFG
jgi:hypothetical protein